MLKRVSIHDELFNQRVYNARCLVSGMRVEREAEMSEEERLYRTLSNFIDSMKRKEG